MQSSSGLINIHELRWLGDWPVVPAGGRGRQAHSGSYQLLAAFVRLAVGREWQTLIIQCNRRHVEDSFSNATKATF